MLPDLLAARLAARLDRQQILHQAGRSWLFFLDEMTLRTVPGDATTRCAQWTSLALLLGQGRVRVRVIPAKFAHAGVAVGRFWLFGFAAFWPVVCTQTDTVSLFAEREADLVAYERILERLHTPGPV